MPEVRNSIRRRSVRLQLILTGVAFLFGGIAGLEEGNVTLTVVHFVMALLNILAAVIVSKHPLRTNITLFIVNAVFAGVLSYLYYRAGNDQMPYAWGFISLVSIVGGVVYYIKEKRKRQLAV